MGAFMQSTRSGVGSTGGGVYPYDLKQFNSSMFGRGDSANSPQLLDPSEFPSLTNTRGQNDQSLPHTASVQAPGTKPYGNFFTSCEFKFQFITFLSVKFLLFFFNKKKKKGEELKTYKEISFLRHEFYFNMFYSWNGEATDIRTLRVSNVKRRFSSPTRNSNI